jgi:hypothetical protein
MMFLCFNIGIYCTLNYVIGKYLISMTSFNFMMDGDVPFMFWVIMVNVPLTLILTDKLKPLISYFI